ncbi:transmembrane protein [Mycobacteroides abscessus subsp. abscessus]|nr:transmembrane protein [Mycobacteroides abscessus subsp. abscessus]
MSHTLGSSNYVTTADGRALHYQVAGSGEPTVVFESGMGFSRTAWGLVQPLVAQRLRSVVYDRANLGRSDDDPAPWARPRIVYLQHASDPIAWFNPDLILSKPDWLREPRGYDVLPSMEWIPFVTFLQVSADMAVAVDVPDGHGHVYVKAVADAWAAVLQPPGWTPEKTQRLRPLLHSGA